MTANSDLADLCVAYEIAKAREKVAKEEVASLAASIGEYFPSSKEADFDVQQLMNCASSSHDVEIKFTRPTETDWDQDGLQATYDAMIDANVNPNTALEATFKVNKKRLMEVPPKWASEIKSCGLISGHKKNGDLRAPKIAIKVSAK